MRKTLSVSQYRGRDLNPHGLGPGDFKSPVSTVPPPRRCHTESSRHRGQHLPLYPDNPHDPQLPGVHLLLDRVSHHVDRTLSLDRTVLRQPFRVNVTHFEPGIFGRASEGVREMARCCSTVCRRASNIASRATRKPKGAWQSNGLR